MAKKTKTAGEEAYEAFVQKLKDRGGTVVKLGQTFPRDGGFTDQVKVEIYENETMSTEDNHKARIALERELDATINMVKGAVGHPRSQFHRNYFSLDYGDYRPAYAFLYDSVQGLLDLYICANLANAETCMWSLKPEEFEHHRS